MTVLEKNKTLDLRVIPLPEGSLCAKADEENAQLRQIKDVGIYLAALPIQTLHTLHQEVSDELSSREKHALSIISEVKMKNEKIFSKKAQALKEK